MRNISPSEREILERAAKHVKIFERVPKAEKPDPLFTRGCFDCNHPCGSMSQDREYLTIEIVAMNDGYYDSGGEADGWDRIAFVVSPNDMFWMKENKGLLPKLFHAGGVWPNQYKYFYTMEDLSMYPKAYVRQVSYRSDNALHVNSIIDIHSYMVDDLGVSPHAEIGLSTTPSSYATGVYVDPTYPLAGADTIVFPESIHVSTPGHMLVSLLKDAYGLGAGKIGLKRIYAEKASVANAGAKKPKKTVGSINYWDQVISANADLNFAVDPFEPGDA